MMTNEADTCRRKVVPALQAAGWDEPPHEIAEQRSFTDGRLIPVGGGVRRRAGRRADYLLMYTADVTLAVVEAKPAFRHAADGLQQAKEYAATLGLRFAYSTNGILIIEADLSEGTEREITAFPSPDDLWARFNYSPAVAERLLAATHSIPGKRLRYYQQIAIHRAVASIATGADRTLLTLATGTGKTAVAFQICWKLWKAKWNRKGDTLRGRLSAARASQVSVSGRLDAALPSLLDRAFAGAL